MPVPNDSLELSGRNIDPIPAVVPPIVTLPLTVDPPETTASLALRTPTVATPRILS